MELIDWGTASLGPVGWALTPLVFGPAPPGDVARVVRTCALLPHPFTPLPRGQAMGAPSVGEDMSEHARRKAAFVRSVLDTCLPARRPAAAWASPPPRGRP